MKKPKTNVITQREIISGIRRVVAPPWKNHSFQKRYYLPKEKTQKARYLTNVWVHGKLSK